jgi:cysteine desulfurase / selenocysteine lyase
MASPDKMIYLDNAATTFPKPREVLSAMVEAYAAMGVSPGRGSYDLSREAEELVTKVRGQICQFFGGDDPQRVIFGYNATDALNTLIQGLVKPGCHVVSSRLEHNSVLRPLHHLRAREVIRLDLVSGDARGFIDPQDIARAIRPETRLVILTHASNVLGTVQPVAEIGVLCRQRGVPLALDVVQSAGVIPIDMARWQVSAVAFTGHKALLGPSGIGGLVLSRDLEVATSRFGGTGVESSSLTHTQSYPNRLEAGTINLLGVIGLGASLRYLKRQGIDRLYAQEMALLRRLRDGLAGIPEVRLFGADSLDHQVPLLSCNIEGMEPEETSSILDGDFGICTRAGLHCAPLIHQDLRTFPKGAVRFSVGPFTTPEDIDRACVAMEEIARLRRSG